MLPVQFGLRLRFTEEIRRYSLSYEILTTLGGKISEPERISERGVRLLLNEDKVSVIWAPTHCEIRVENVSDKEHCIDRVISVLETINSVAPIEELRDSRFLTYWILPTPQYDFLSLERKYRDMMIVENDISNAAYDSSVILDISADKWTLHHQSGVMEPQQLMQEYLRFKRDDVPKTFLFLEASIFNKNVVKYSKEAIHTFMTKSLEYCVSHMEEFNRIWEGRL